MKDKVIVTSMVSGNVGLTLPHLRFSKTWPKKGTKIAVDKEILREAMYEAGVEYMFREGILYIEDMDFKIELGLEKEDTKTPTEIVPVDDKYLNRVLKLMPVAEMKNVVSKMNSIQKAELADYAIGQNDIQLDRIKIISELCGVDILKAIELKRQKEE